MQLTDCTWTANGTTTVVKHHATGIQATVRRRAGNVIATIHTPGAKPRDVELTAGIVRQNLLAELRAAEQSLRVPA